MATKYTLILNNVKFLVNPTALTINKGVLMSSLNLQSGTKYYVWYDSPEVLTITGQAAGSTAYKELLFLKDNFERTNKTSTLFYKTQLYYGMITSLRVTFDATDPNRFGYEINFQLLFGQRFKIEDFALNPTGVMGQIGGLLGGIEDFVNVNLSKAEDWVANIKI